MVGQINRLTTMKVRTLSKAGRHSDGGNLYLNITSSGAKSWIFLYRLSGKQREMGLGSAQSVPLTRARELAASSRQLLAENIDPMLARKLKETPTFGVMADQYIEDMKAGWRNEKHIAQWKMTLREYAKSLRPIPVDQIITEDVLRVLKPLWTSKHETAKRLRGRIEAVLDAASSNNLRKGENPARWRGHLATLLPKRNALSRGHHAALAFKDLPDFMARLRELDGSSPRALEFAILTATRSGETLGAQWAEIDFETRVWIVPAQRMKAGRDHRVPLTSASISVLQRMRQDLQSDYVFPGSKPNRPLSNMALAMVMRRLKAKATPHGFRSTFRDWAAEKTHVPHEVCEMALAHAIGSKTEAAYRRGDLFEKRRPLMEAWASACALQPTNVVSLIAKRSIPV